VITIRLPHRIHAANGCDFEIAPEFDDREMPELWRELARPVILFDERSPGNIFANEIDRIFRKKRARLDSNPRPQA
jgi:hypothetical protein